MFCKYCGVKLKENEVVCPHCGKERGGLQSTDGYFGVLDQIAKIGSVETVASASKPLVAGSDDQSKVIKQKDDTIFQKNKKITDLSNTVSRYKTLLIIAASATGVLLVLFLITLVMYINLNSSNKELETRNKIYEKLEKECEKIVSMRVDEFAVAIGDGNTEEYTIVPDSDGDEKDNTIEEAVKDIDERTGEIDSGDYQDINVKDGIVVRYKKNMEMYFIKKVYLPADSIFENKSEYTIYYGSDGAVVKLIVDGKKTFYYEEDVVAVTDKDGIYLDVEEVRSEANEYKAEAIECYEKIKQIVEEELKEPEPEEVPTPEPNKDNQKGKVTPAPTKEVKPTKEAEPTEEVKPTKEAEPTEEVKPTKEADSTNKDDSVEE